jgi:deoxyribodipyrimidine photolyase-related protein
MESDHVKHILLLFPHQLFEPSLYPISTSQISQIILYEHPLYFQDPERLQQMNCLKRIFHRASMKAYFDIIKFIIKSVHYIDWSSKHDLDCVLSYVKKMKGTYHLHFIDPVDHMLRQRIQTYFDSHISYTIHETPLFLTSKEECHRYATPFKKTGKRIQQTPFYIYQRKKLNLFVSKDGKPKGGKWTYDVNNRKPFPAQIDLPIVQMKMTKEDMEYVEEARIYVKQTFSTASNLGSIDNPLLFPIRHQTALQWLRNFFKTRFPLFGIYQDAFCDGTKAMEHPFLFHSGISCLLNVGLLTPKQVVKEVCSYIRTHKIPYSTIEGFLRQIIGWREHCRLTYETYYEEMKKANIYHHNKQLTEHWYKGTTGLKPIDDAIQMGFRYGYLHHILRLMVMGSMMCMLEVDPNCAMKWFYEMSCDSYEWNMINNVKCMAMYADGGTIYTTKPYIASSNYIRKMSTYKKDGVWNIVWDACYWYYVAKHQDVLRKTGRFIGSSLQKRSEEEKKRDKQIVRSIQKKLLFIQ